MAKLWYRRYGSARSPSNEPAIEFVHLTVDEFQIFQGDTVISAELVSPEEIDTAVDGLITQLESARRNAKKALTRKKSK